MAALFLFVLAVAGGVLVADLVWENPATGQVTVLDHTVTGYPEGWVLGAAAGLGFVVALLLVASVNSTKGRRARRKQLRRLRGGLYEQVVSPEPDHAQLLDEFFGPEEESSPYLGGPARPAVLEREVPEGRVEGSQRLITPEQVQGLPEPLYEQAGLTGPKNKDGEDRAEGQNSITSERIQYPPEPLYEQARRAAGLHQDWELPFTTSHRRPR